MAARRPCLGPTGGAPAPGFLQVVSGQKGPETRRLSLALPLRGGSEALAELHVSLEPRLATPSGAVRVEEMRLCHEGLQELGLERLLLRHGRKASNSKELLISKGSNYERHLQYRFT